jgi:WD40 repeat protein
MRSGAVSDPTLQQLLACQAYNLYQKTTKRNTQNTWIYGALAALKRQQERLDDVVTTKKITSVRAMVSTQGNYVYATGAGNIIYKIDIKQGGKLTPAVTHKYTNFSLSLDPANSTLACVGASKYIKLYSIDKGGNLSLKSQIKTKYREIVQVVMIGRNELYTAAEGELVHWANKEEKWVQTIIAQKQTSLLMGAYQKKIAWSKTGKHLKYRNIATGTTTELALTGNNADMVKVIKFSPDGQWLAVGTSAGQLYLWSLKKGKPELIQSATFKQHLARVHTIAFGDYDRHGKVRKMAVGSWDRSVCVYDLNYLNKLPLNIEVPNWAWALAFSGDGSKVLISDRQGKIQLWATTMQALKDEVTKARPPKRNLSLKEWKTFVAPDLIYERTFANLPNGEGVD